jgi:hypothetical protein
MALVHFFVSKHSFCLSGNNTLHGVVVPSGIKVFNGDKSG